MHHPLHPAVFEQLRDRCGASSPETYLLQSTAAVSTMMLPLAPMHDVLCHSSALSIAVVMVAVMTVHPATCLFAPLVSTTKSCTAARASARDSLFDPWRWLFLTLLVRDWASTCYDLRRSSSAAAMRRSRCWLPRLRHRDLAREIALTSSSSLIQGGRRRRLGHSRMESRMLTLALAMP